MELKKTQKKSQISFLLVAAVVVVHMELKKKKGKSCDVSNVQLKN